MENPIFRPKQQGFTLVELMVALVGGLFVSLAVFAMARQSTKFASSQMRVSDSMLQSVVAFDRLQADIARAGYLTTPNIARDPKYCGTYDATYPAWLARFGAVYIETAAANQLTTEITDNGLAPKNIVMTGSYASLERFEIEGIRRTGSTQAIELSDRSFGIIESGYNADPLGTMKRIFAKDRALRIVDKKGFFHYAIIASVSIDPPTITLRDSPKLKFMGEGGLKKCGIPGHAKGVRVNVVNIIRYRMGTFKNDASYGSVYGPGPFSEATRRELIREELDTEGVAFPGSQEMVAEYLVDLDFELLVENPTTGILTTESSISSQWAGDVPSQVNTPQLIRGVHAWLSTRSREADRTVGLSVATTGAGPKLQRINLVEATSSAPPAFARVSSQQAIISLSNQNEIIWR